MDYLSAEVTIMAADSRMAFSADGKWLISGGSADDHSVRIWDVSAKTQCALLTGHTQTMEFQQASMMQAGISMA